MKSQKYITKIISISVSLNGNYPGVQLLAPTSDGGWLVAETFSMDHFMRQIEIDGEEIVSMTDIDFYNGQPRAKLLILKKSTRNSRTKEKAFTKSIK